MAPRRDDDGRHAGARAALPAHRPAEQPAAGYPAAYGPVTQAPQADRASGIAAARASWAESLYPQEPRMEPRVRVSRFMALLRRGRMAGFLAAFAVWGGVAAYIALAPPKYESKAVMLIDTKRLAEIVNRYGAEDAGFGAFGGAKVANQAEILRIAPVIAETTAIRLLGSASAAEQALLPRTADGGQSAEWIALWLQESAVSVSPQGSDDEADVIEIAATALSPGLAARIADTYVRSYVDLIRDGVRQQRARAIAFQQDRLDEYEGEVAAIDERLRDFWKANGTLTVSAEAETAMRHVSELRSALDDAQIDFSTHEATLASLETEMAALDPDALSAQIASSADAELRAIQAEIAALEVLISQYYTRTPSLRDDPSPSPKLVKLLGDVAAQRHRSDELSRQLVGDILSTGGIDLAGNEAGRSYLVGLRQRLAEERVALRAAEAKRDAIQRRLGAFEASKRRFSEQAIPLAQLEREKDLAEKRYSTAMEALTALQLDDPGDYVRVIAAAATPREPTGPGPVILIAFGLVLGLLVGGGSAYGKARLDDRIWGADQLELEGAPVDGVLPDVRGVIRRALGGAKQVFVAGRKVDSAIITVSSAHAPEAAIFRKFATRLAATSPRGSVILFTSAESGAGKSVAVANTAAALALSGYRTLLVDADTHRMAQRELLGFSDGCCFDVEAGAFPGGGGLETRDGALRLLYGVTLYSVRSIATEHLAVYQLDRLLRFYREHFDFLLVDTPPITATAFTLAAGTLADRRLLVTACGTSRLELVRQARSEMAAAGAPITGFVLTRFDTAGSPVYRSAYNEIRGYHPAPVRP